LCVLYTTDLHSENVFKIFHVFSVSLLKVNVYLVVEFLSHKKSQLLSKLCLTFVVFIKDCALSKLVQRFAGYQLTEVLLYLILQ